MNSTPLTPAARMVLVPSDVLSQLGSLPDTTALCARVTQVVMAAAAHQRPEWLNSPEIAAMSDAQVVPLERGRAETPYGNLLELLDRGAQTSDEWLVLAAAAALGLGRGFSELEAPLAIEQLCWLAEHTPCNPWLLLDECLGESSAAFWGCAAEQIERMNDAARLSIAAAIVTASSAGALDFKRALSERSPSPTLQHLLSLGLPLQALCGELRPAPSPWWLLLLQAFTGWLLLAGTCRIVARYALGRRHRATLRISGGGVLQRSELWLLGRKLSEREQVTPLRNLISLERQTRLPRAGLYAGLLSLAFGTYFGSAMMLDGLRVPGGSPSLLGYGLAIVTLGLLLDFGLSALDRLGKSRSSLVVQSERRKPVVLANVPAAEADAWLERAALLRA